MIHFSDRNFNRVLLVSFLFISLLIASRIWYSGTWRYIFIAWNLFLAWLPYFLSTYFKKVKNSALWKQASLFFCWVLFLPNALYIVTDLIHLRAFTNVPLWYDSALLFAAAFTGIMMAFISIRKAELFLREKFNYKIVKFFVPLMLFMSSFGVYLGRFERWNSWDIFVNPIGLGPSIFSCIITPVHNYKVWATTIIFTGVFSMLYFFITPINDGINKKQPG
jgi:uncharacterized membrane protein